MMTQMIAKALVEDHQVAMVAEAMMNPVTVVILMEEHQMDVVEDQQQEGIQMADLLWAGAEVLQEIQTEDHHPPELQMEEVVIKTGAKAHQQEEIIALLQAMEEEEVIKKVALLQAAGEVHVDVVNER